MKKLCGRKIKKSRMRESRPCINRIKHLGPCTPNLTGLKDHFGYAEIIKRAKDFIVLKGKRISRQTRWLVKDHYGNTRVISACHLFSAHARGLRALRKSGLGSVLKNGKLKPEYNTIINHWRLIFNRKNSKYNAYKNMGFYDAWNPDKEGSILVGALWLEKNLPKPSPDHDLHVIKSKKYPFGFFGPKGIVWRHKMDCHDQMVLDLVCEWSDKKFNDFIQQENIRRGKGKP